MGVPKETYLCNGDATAIVNDTTSCSTGSRSEHTDELRHHARCVGAIL